MEKIKIITDSTADLPLDIVEKYDIEVIPLTVHFGKESYKDGVDIKLNEFLKKMEESNELPVTSQINPQCFYEYYNRYIKEGYKIISIHISSKLSGTYQSACIAKDMIGSEDIIVIDSFNVTSGLGLLVIKAAKLVKEGFTIKEIEEKIIEIIPHVKSALAFESLENLVKGGRLSKTAGVIGGILNIRIIITIENGELIVFDKVRGSKKAAKVIWDYLKEKGIKSGETVALLQAENKNILEILKENLITEKIEFIETEVGCVVGTHSGTGACGLFFIEKY
ncbi:EDD domain protein, DegV family [Clostridium sp. USBA 49]|uniref:DegV family protein n=1 Tax=Clostridium sp. USBA 49 TaxID=1881060 RepID=UPI00099AF754|nr:DegV family protein [Clostridium sp. USBA 49]SKA73085.1 EDD domain protein, DegV family [Clostridium sp. USBA 49]